MSIRPACRSLPSSQITTSPKVRWMAGRRGGQLLTRARGSSYASACPHLRAPGASVPDGRTIRHDHDDRGRTSAPRSSYRLPMPSNVCTRSSSAASRPRPSCRRRKPPPCSSGRCSRPDRSPCARSTAGRLWRPNQPTRSLTSPPEPLTSNRRRRHHGNSNHIPDSTKDASQSRSRALCRTSCKIKILVFPFSESCSRHPERIHTFVVDSLTFTTRLSPLGERV
jgi:hypothetical protein